MGKIRTLVIPESDRAVREILRATSPLPYVRERAAALLKIAAGIPAAWVARAGLLVPRNEDTVYAWMNRYEADGIAGLMTIQSGRGRKSAFSPSVPNARRASRRGAGSGRAPARHSP